MMAAILGIGSVVNPLTVFIVVGLGLLALVALRGRGQFGGGSRSADYAPKPLLSAWEAKAFLDIRTNLPVGYYACPQVRLADMVKIRPSDPSSRRIALNRVAMKSVDFVIINGSGQVALVIELDDRTHSRPDRIARDKLVDCVLGQCGIPIVHVKPGQRVSVAAQLSRLPGLA